MRSYSSSARVIGPPVSAVSTEPILFAQVPAFDTVHHKLVSFVDGVPSLANSSKIKSDLAQEIFPWLKQHYVEKSKAPTSPAVVSAFGRTMAALAASLPAASMFPLLDVWRLAILEPAIAQVTLTPLVKVLAANSESVSSSPRATLLHEDRLVRVVAASLSFNVGAWVQKGRVARIKGEEVADGCGQTKRMESGRSNS